jgi:hypothetical protein
MIHTVTFPARIPRPEDWPKPPKLNGKPLPPAPNYDGDSATFEVDRYMDDQSILKGRFFTVFCPEIKQVGGPDCRIFVTDWIVENSSGHGEWPLWVDTIRNRSNTDEVESLSRYMIMVWNYDRTRCLNHEISQYVFENRWPGGTGS